MCVYIYPGLHILALAGEINVINLIAQIPASQIGILAIYLCHQPTTQLHTLVPDGSERRLRVQIDCAEWVKL